MDKEDLKQYLIDEAEYNAEDVERMECFELLDNYLSYNGIIGYTEDICHVVMAAFGVKLW